MISHIHFSGKLILAAAGLTGDSFFFGQVEIALGKMILATVGSTDRLIKKLISTSDIIYIIFLQHMYIKLSGVKFVACYTIACYTSKGAAKIPLQERSSSRLLIG